jgi:hypothetical protein
MSSAAGVFANESVSLGLGGLSVLIRRFQSQNSDSDDEVEEDSDHHGHMETDSETEDESAVMEDETDVDELPESIAVSPRSSLSVRRHGPVHQHPRATVCTTPHTLLSNLLTPTIQKHFRRTFDGGNGPVQHDYIYTLHTILYKFT